MCLYVHFGAVSVFIQLRKQRCNSKQGFGAFFGLSCDCDRFLFPFISEFLSLFFLFLDFIAISDCVFNNKNNYSTWACWISNNYNHFGSTYAPRWLSIISSAPSLYAKLRVATRVYDVEGGVIFSKNSTFVFFDGAAWTPRFTVSIPDYGSWWYLRPVSRKSRQLFGPGAIF